MVKWVWRSVRDSFIITLPVGVTPWEVGETGAWQLIGERRVKA